MARGLRKKLRVREKQNLHTSLPDDTGNGSSLFPVSFVDSGTNAFRALTKMNDYQCGLGILSNEEESSPK
jgi:hypothetical protein